MSSKRCLLLSCSKAKRQDADSLPALHRYDGPLFRVLRRYLIDCGSNGVIPDVYILSAEFGLISSDQAIPDYDQRMTSHRALELRPAALSRLEQVLRVGEYHELFISMGKSYLGALEGYESLIPAELKVTVCSGGLGRQQARLYRWLRGDSSSQESEIRQIGRARIRGAEVTHTPEQAMEIARKALVTGREGAARYESWYVQIEDQRVAVKWMVNKLTGLDVGVFSTGEARRFLGQLGIEVKQVL